MKTTYIKKTKNFVELANEAQHSALKAGATPEQALKFYNLYQVEAFKDGVTVKQALRFEDLCQLVAFRLGATPEQALKFDNHHQVIALRAGARPEYALTFTEEYSEAALQAYIMYDNFTHHPLETLQNLVPESIIEHKLSTTVGVGFSAICDFLGGGLPCAVAGAGVGIAAEVAYDYLA
jgi:hypothetical protein